MTQIYYSHGQNICVKKGNYGKSSISIFQEFFDSIEKMSILGGRLSTKLSFYEVLKFFWYFLRSLLLTFGNLYIPSSLLIIKFRLGEKNIWSNMKKSQNIMTMAVSLVCYFSQSLTGKLYFQMRSNSKRRFDFSIVNLNKKLCEAIPRLYAVTGSDFTGSFYGLGKTKGVFFTRK